MSGHSKFANIKHKKERNDAAKGKIFTVIGREIAVAVKGIIFIPFFFIFYIYYIIFFMKYQLKNY